MNGRTIILVLVTTFLLAQKSRAIDTEMHDAGTVARSLLGLPHREVYDSFRKNNRLWDCNTCWTSRRDNGHIIGLARHQIGRGRYLILSYDGISDPWGNINDDDRVTSSEIVSFSDRKLTSLADLPDLVWQSVITIHYSSPPRPEVFDPVAVIRAVNALRSKPKDVVIAALQAYRTAAMDYSSPDRFTYDLDQERIPIICFLLFVPQDRAAKMPAFPFRGIHADVTLARRTWPLFPLVVVRDTPFYVAQRGSWDGPPYDPSGLIEFCSRFCTLREAPLVPDVSPVDAVSALYTSATWRIVFSGKGHLELDEAEITDGTRNKYFVREQCMRCVHRYIPDENEPRSDFSLFPSDTFGDPLWKRVLSHLGTSPFAWNAMAQEFQPVVQGGSAPTKASSVRGDPRR